MAYVIDVRIGGYISDLDPIWHAARAWLADNDPYAAIGPGRAFPWPWGLSYPFPAVLALVPLAGLDVLTARLVFVAIGAALYAYAVTRHSYVPLVLLLSIPFYSAVHNAQWSTYIAASLLLPGVGWVLACKPNIGLAVFAGQTNPRRAMLAASLAAALLVVSLVLAPSWPASWLDALRGQTQFRPYVTLPGGVLLLLAATRWRRPEARVLLVAALVPANPATYDTLPVLTAVVALEPKMSLRAALILALVAGGTLPFLSLGVPLELYDEKAELTGIANTAIVMLPALLVILRRPRSASSDSEVGNEVRPVRVVGDEREAVHVERADIL